MLAVAGLEVFGVLLGGYASASKWSLYGAMARGRPGCQLRNSPGHVRGCAGAAGRHHDLVAIGDAQQGWITNWYLLHDPFTFMTFWIYVTCATASVNRAPFDLPEAESELVAGFMTQYSGFRGRFDMMAEYTADVRRQCAGRRAVPGRMERARAGGAFAGADGQLPTPSFHLAGQPAGAGQLAGEGLRRRHVHGCGCAGRCRAARIDQVMATCRKYCAPLASIVLVGVMLGRSASPAPAELASGVDDVGSNPLAQRLLLPAGPGGRAAAVAVVVSPTSCGWPSSALSLSAVSGLFFLAGADFLAPCN